jgi:hypothetical protein
VKGNRVKAAQTILRSEEIFSTTAKMLSFRV